MRLRNFLAPMAIVLLSTIVTTNVALAVTYDFLKVTGNNVSGNGAFSQFNSVNGNGVITVSHFFPNPAGVGGFDNKNTAINSQYNTLFPGTGPVDGHLAMTVYQYQSVVTFNTANYAISQQDTIFGVWNITDEVSWPPGPGGSSQPVYRIELLDLNNGVTTPSSFLLYGNAQNQLDAQGRRELTLNAGTGELFPGISINGGNGIHTNAAFFYNIPATTLEIRVYADLPTLNTIGDGVGYYFAEVHIPEPAGGAILLSGAIVGMLRQRRLR